MKRTLTLVLLAALLVMGSMGTSVRTARADDTLYTEGTLYYTIANQSITIVGCFSRSADVRVPAMIAGIPVNAIATGAFANNTYVKTVYLPDTICIVQPGAFASWVRVVYNANTDHPQDTPTDLILGLLDPSSGGPQATELPAEPQATEPPAEPQATEPPAEPQATEPPAEPQATEPPAEPQATEPPAEPQATEPPASPTHSAGGSGTADTSELKAVYGSEGAAPEATIAITQTFGSQDASSGKYSVSNMAQWFVPQDCSVMEMGFVWSTDDERYADHPDELMLDGDNAKKHTSGMTGNSSIYTFHLRTSNPDLVCYERAYLIYRDPNGDTQTIYCDTVSESFNSLTSACSHEWSEWLIVTESTCTEAGERTRTCSLCGITETEVIPPWVLSQSPEKYYYYENVYTPTLVYTFNAEIVDAANADRRFYIDDTDVTDAAVWTADSVTLSGYAVSSGDHTVQLTLVSFDDSQDQYETCFSCGDGSIMHLYAGEVHSHTSDSDGQGTVQEAYEYARDVAGLDYFAVTDHSGSFPNSTFQGSQIPNADAYNDPGNFVALYGYEQTYSINTGYYGHLNAINHSSLTTWAISLREFYDVMAQDPEAVVMFNHPGYSWGNFLEYGYYSSQYDNAIDLIEVKSRAVAEYEYPLALSKGWHVSPVYNEDNHTADWGTATEACGYVLAPALTRQNVLEAFNKHRTYTTNDRSMRVYYQINGNWMGSRLNGNALDQLNFNVQLSTEKANGIGKISIVAEDGIVVYSANAGSAQQYQLNVSLPPIFDYYYIAVSSGNSWCYTAPIWIENREQLTVDEVHHELLVNGSKKHRVYATFTNHANQAMTDVAVKFYQGALSDFDLSTNPVKTVTIGDLAAGETMTVNADVVYKPSAPRVYAVVSGTLNGKQYSAVRYFELSTLYVTEILPNTAGSDAFEFIELYNNSDKALDLSQVKMRYYVKAGMNQSALEAYTWQLSGVIQPHSTMVVWRVRSDNPYTVDDFNQAFHTNLVEGQNIVILTGNHLPHKKPVQLELCVGSSAIARIWYNWNKAEDVSINESIQYNYPEGYTITAKVKRAHQTPTPGTLEEGQVPNIVTE